jgi:hypothetical protein
MTSPSNVTFKTGATRTAETTYDPSGFLNPRVLQLFCEYMEKHRTQADGTLRDSDNWQKGMPTSRTIRSLLRHTFDLWLISRGHDPKSPDCKTPMDALCAIYFNVGRLILNYDSGQHYEEKPDEPTMESVSARVRTDRSDR